MSRVESYDIAIVGAGIVGASIAYFTSQRKRVLLIEAEQAPGYHATGRSAALFTEAYGPANIRALSRASRAFFDAPPHGFTDVPLLKARGTLFPGGEHSIADVRQLHADLIAEGCRARLMDFAEAKSLVPVLRQESAVLSVYDEEAFDVDVDALLQGFLRGAKAQGAKLATKARVSRVVHELETGTWSVESEDGRTFKASKLVNASGAWADVVAAMAGAPAVGIVPKRRSAFLFEAPQGMSSERWPAVIAVDESWYFKPDAGLLLGSPANVDPVDPHDVVPEELDVMVGIHRIEEATTLQINRPRSTWAGLRSFVEDGEPVCGFADDQKAFFWAAALGGYGIQTSPAFGRLCAGLLIDGCAPDEIANQGIDLGALSPARDGLRSQQSRA